MAVWIVWGAGGYGPLAANGPCFPCLTGCRLAEQLGAAGPRLAVLPACGHLSHEEAPQGLLDFLQSFLLEQSLGCLPR